MGWRIYNHPNPTHPDTDMDITQLQTDPELETQGAWITYGDAEFLIASNTSAAYKRALAKHGRQIKPHMLKADPELGTKIVIEAMADAVLLDWKNVTAEGKPLPVTRENKVKLLKLKPIQTFVAEACDDIANFQKEVAEQSLDDLKSHAPVEP